MYSKYINNNPRKEKKDNKINYIHNGVFVVVYETKQWLNVINVRFTFSLPT